MFKQIMRIIICIILALILLVGGYLLYANIAYYRLEDHLSLETTGIASQSLISTNETHRIASANIGFGAYSDDYTFFMDGGKESRALSKDAVFENVTGDVTYVNSLSPDIVLFQEVDLGSTRNYKVDEMKLIQDILADICPVSLSYTFAQNYDSPYLFWPLYKPHGKCHSGILTASSYEVNDSERISLPIEDGFTKFFDLDRCYSKHYIKTDAGNYLVVYNVHLSAYTTDPSTALNQVVILNDDMLTEYNNGNYIIAGGDMNKDMLGDSSEYFGVESPGLNWTKPFPTDLLDSHLQAIGPFDENNMIPSCRNVDVPYSENPFVLTVDGFIVSDNVEVVESKVFDAKFRYSDHNPVYLDFNLK